MSRQTNLVLTLGAHLLLALCLLAPLDADALDSPLNNIDILEPVVRRSPVIGSNDPLDRPEVNDYFGWSMVLHQIEEVNDGDSLNTAIDRTRIIIGAPKGTFPGGLGYDDPGKARSIETGLIYSCPISPGLCEGVRGDTTRYLGNRTAENNNGSGLSSSTEVFPQSFVEGRLFDQAPASVFRDTRVLLTDLELENKTGQLLGSTLYSDGMNFIACAPRWTDKRSSKDILEARGICYVSGRNLQGFDFLRPCVGVSSTGLGGAGTNTGQQYCQAGKAAVVHRNDYVLSAPGIFTSRGVLWYSSTDASNSGIPRQFRQGNENEPNSTQQLDETILNQYQGFTVIKAFITQSRSAGDTNADIVASVPRFNEDTYLGRINVYNNDRIDIIDLSVNATGTQMAEFFGYAMTAADLNGDGWDELIVGAPMYTDFDTLTVEKGRIHVFYNTGAGTLTRCCTIEGRTAGERFGTSVTNLGDIDNDGFEDIAVGAPYSKFPSNNTGTVYILYGSNNQSAFPSQTPFVITADDIVSSVRTLNSLNTFGFSLSSGIDVDNNKYNDLVIGAYESQTVVLLRTLPVITVTVDILQVDDIDIDMIRMRNVTVIASYTSATGVTGTFRIPFNLTEVPQGPEFRLFFESGNEGSTFASNVFVLERPGENFSVVVPIFPKQSIATTQPYVLRLDLGVIDRVVNVDEVTGNQTITDFALFPRIRQAGDNIEMVGIVDPCNNDGCISDVRLTTPSSIMLTAGMSRSVNVPIMYENIGDEAALNVTLVVSQIPNIFTSLSIANRACRPIVNGSSNCTILSRLAPSIRGNETLTISINNAIFIGNEQDFDLDVRLEVETSDLNSANRNFDRDLTNNVQMITFDVNARAEVTVAPKFGSDTFRYTQVAPRSDPPPTISELGQSVTLMVQVNNSGPSTVRRGSLTVLLPYMFNTNNQFTLLYPTDININSANDAITCDRSFVNPEGLSRSQPQVSAGRRRRAASASRFWDMYSQPSHSQTRQKRQESSVSVDCSDRDQCITIKCNITNLGTGQSSVDIRTRIDERFFASQEDQLVYKLTVTATVTVEGDFYGDNPDNNQDMRVVTLEPPLPQERRPLHEIIWPIIGGVLILILAGIFLYFVGFFRRKRKPGEDEIEGDFDLPEKKVAMEEIKTGENGADTTDEITKV